MGKRRAGGVGPIPLSLSEDRGLPDGGLSEPVAGSPAIRVASGHDARRNQRRDNRSGFNPGEQEGDHSLCERGVVASD